ncbi:MAG: prepilin-type N-terminal cleavage/methylation domain-containing protein, partial [Thermoguttaceae bacterium]|nr:prepilin-type N-terminal cleavage/methylation domain-containing protein [Thermoguttaceae bacterium]
MRRAFTLLELLIVLAIVTTIAGISVASFQRYLTRSRFKAGVVEVQIDLHRTRLLAMQTGTPYIFRYAPGSGVYEIAPLDALQEAIYRQNDATDLNGAFGDESLVGSLSETALTTDAAAYPTDAGLYGVAGSGATPDYADDLFSPANVAADMERLGLGTGTAFGAGLGIDPTTSAIGGDLTGSLGTVGAFDAAALGYAADAGAGFGDPGFSTEGGAVGLAVDPLTGLPLASASATETTWRELKPEEKALLDEGGDVLVWRVAPEGVVYRKAASG